MLTDQDVKELMEKFIPDRNNDNHAEWWVGLIDMYPKVDPALKAAFQQFNKQSPETEAYAFATWVRDYPIRQRQQAIVSVGIDKEDAFWIARMNDETRARILIDGKSIP